MENELICPYCGAPQLCHEPEEISAHVCTTVCESCGEPFEYAVTVTRYYFPTKTEEDKP